MPTTLSGEPNAGQHGLLPAREIFAYGLPALPMQMILLVTVIYLPSFYAIQRGLSMAAIGAMFFAARLWDAVTDTLIGGLSDSSVSRWGRRKPWVVLSSPLLLVSAGFLFMPPASGASSLYLGLWLFLFYLSWTMVQIPYLAWGAELSQNYGERNKVAGFREAFGTIGIMLATGLPLIFLSEHERDLSGVLRIAFFSILLMLPLTVAVAAGVARIGEMRRPEGRFNWRSMLKAFTGNKLFVRFITGQLLFATAWNVCLASIVIVIEYELQLKGQYLSLILLMNFSATVCMPLALKLGKKFDKHKTLAIAIAGFVIFYIALSFMPPNHYKSTAVAFIFLGTCWAPTLISTNAMIPDIVDVGAFNGQHNQAGIYMALFYMVIKMAMALGVGLGLPLLEAAGLNLKDASLPSGQHAINVVSFYFPAVMSIPAIVLFWTYPLTRKKHGVLRRWLDAHQIEGQGRGSNEAVEAHG